MNFNKHFFILFFLVTVLFYSCDTDMTDNDDDSYDRSLILSNWSNNIITPAYNEFYNSLYSLNQDVNLFVNNPSVDHLVNLSSSWIYSYKIWQHIEMFDIGLAEVINFKGKMNIYPTDVELINNNILSQNYDLNNNNNFDARGFPAIDYLIHGLAETNEEIVQFYINDNSYSNYLSSVVSTMMYNTDLIIDDWLLYSNDFINSTDNTATSSLNKMINDFIYYFEKGLRANKIGIPAGIFSNNPIPTAVEGYYKKDISKELALEALSASRNFFIGKHFTSDITDSSLDSYLNFLDVSSDINLSEIIILQFLEAENQLNQLNDNFVEQITTNNMEMLLTYDAIQQLVVSFKVDMLQALSISVDYVDADGD
ncbi:MAG: peptidase M75 superfamily protein [Flavobacteriales bacterium]|nr:peptidase M75 superfamily protein [Flavobacteriales bacterium]|tara:strand:+ start:1712 stop:2815 length:1104 start_codon:yes stop_codon:yes gene_type:complete